LKALVKSSNFGGFARAFFMENMGKDNENILRKGAPETHKVQGYVWYGI
jgi:hypothetical protein